MAVTFWRFPYVYFYVCLSIYLYLYLVRNEVSVLGLFAATPYVSEPVICFFSNSLSCIFTWGSGPATDRVVQPVVASAPAA